MRNAASTWRVVLLCLVSFAYWGRHIGSDGGDGRGRGICAGASVEVPRKPAHTQNTHTCMRCVSENGWLREIHSHRVGLMCNLVRCGMRRRLSLRGGAKEHEGGGGDGEVRRGGLNVNIRKIITDTPRVRFEDHTLEQWEDGTPRMERDTRRNLSAMQQEFAVDRLSAHGTSLDTGHQTGRFTAVDTGLNTGCDTRLDASLITGLDTGHETGLHTSHESGLDTGNPSINAGLASTSAPAALNHTKIIRTCTNIANSNRSASFVLQFGKYRGKRLSEVPATYLNWLSSTVHDQPDLTTALRDYKTAERRSKSPGGQLDLTAEPWLKRWGIPDSIRTAYRDAGVVTLFEWQVQCLEDTDALQGRNLVYSAPTNGGKTLVAEILMLRTLIVQRKKAILVVPFVSVAAEKVAHLRKLCAGEAMAVSGYYAGEGGTLSANVPELAVCTIEKANGLINRMLEDERLEELGVIAVDEAHMMSDEHRGFLLELMIAKMLVASTCQIICLSATISNLEDLGAWTRAHVYRTDFRPVPLTHYMVMDRQIYDGEGNGPVRCLSDAHINKDPDGVFALCEEGVSQNRSVLVFCATKAACESCAKLLAALMKDSALATRPTSRGEQGAKQTSASKFVKMDGKLETSSSDHDDFAPEAQRGLRQRRFGLLEELGRTPVGLDPALEVCVPEGVAFHHAGLTVDERALLEAGFSDGTISVLVATSTLAAGVNLPAGRVIIRSPYVGMEKLDVARYRQMCGRAGRSGKETLGESFLMVKNVGKEKWRAVGVRREALALMNAPLPALRSCFLERATGDPGSSLKVLCRAVLEAVVSGIARNETCIFTFLRSTLHSTQSPQSVFTVRTALTWLLTNDFLTVTTQKCLNATEVSRAQNTSLPTSSSSSSSSQNTSLPSSLLSSSSRLSLSSSPQPDLSSSLSSSSSLTLLSLRSTSLGDATFSSSLSPEQALVVYGDLSAARKGLVLTDELHLLYVLTPVYVLIEPSWRRYWSIFQELPEEALSVAQAVGVDSNHIYEMAKNESEGKRPYGSAGGYVQRPPAGSPAARKREIHSRFWAALMLRDLVLEASLSQVCSRYQIARGALQNLQSSASTFAGMVGTFCAKLHWWQFQVLCSSFAERLQNGAQPDIVPLCAVPSVKNFRARALFKAGIYTVQALASSSVETVARALGTVTPFRLKFQTPQRMHAVERKIASNIIKAACELLRTQALEQAYKAESSGSDRASLQVHDDVQDNDSYMSQL